MALRPLLLWLIDDTQANHSVAAATCAQVEGVRFVGFVEPAEADATFTRAVRCGTAPQVILMDFFLGGERGDHLTRRFRGLVGPGPSPVIIGYSSVASGSAAIVAAGGDLALRKHADAEGVNPSLLAWLRTWPRAAS